MNTIAGLNVQTVLNAYIEAALWSSTNPDNEDGDDSNLQAYEVAASASETFRNQIIRLLSDNSALIEKAELLKPGRNASAQFGHDLWLTQHRHGCGFWDGDWSEPEATALTALAHALGEVNLYVNDDGLVDIA